MTLQKLVLFISTMLSSFTASTSDSLLCHLHHQEPTCLFCHRPTTTLSPIETRCTPSRHTIHVESHRRPIHQPTMHIACNNRSAKNRLKNKRNSESRLFFKSVVYSHEKDEQCDDAGYYHCIDSEAENNHLQVQNEIYKHEHETHSSDSRRSFLLLSSFSASTIISGVSKSAHAAKGAAEYDLEYYLRDIVYVFYSACIHSAVDLIPSSIE